MSVGWPADAPSRCAISSSTRSWLILNLRLLQYATRIVVLTTTVSMQQMVRKTTLDGTDVSEMNRVMIVCPSAAKPQIDCSSINFSGEIATSGVLVSMRMLLLPVFYGGKAKQHIRC